MCIYNIYVNFQLKQLYSFLNEALYFIEAIFSILLTEENVEGEMSTEDCKLQDLPPCWGLDIVCGKGTDFNYGPWADRQRYLIKLHFY